VDFEGSLRALEAFLPRKWYNPFPTAIKVVPEVGGTIHKIYKPTKKAAKDAARNAGKGKPLHHPSDKGQQPHYHPVDKDGDKLHDGTHYYYPGPVRRPK
jgi:hypothetical protein